MAILLYYSTVNCNKKNNKTLNCGVIYTHFNYICILVLTTPKMPTWVAETCLWPLCNKITWHDIFVNCNWVDTRWQ